MSTANLDAADLAAVETDGLINEEVMNKIWEIDNFPLPLTERIGSSSIGNARFSWTRDEYAAPLIDDQVVDGSDATGDDTEVGDRVQNYAEEKSRVVRVSTRANASNTIGYSRELARQVSRRQVELRRSVEATMLSNNASQADNGDATPGITGGLNAWIETNIQMGAGGIAGGYNFGTGIVDAYAPGAAEAMSETIFKDLVQAVYQEGGEAMICMGRPSVVRIFSEYQFTDGARVASLIRETAGDKSGPTSSQSAVNVWIGDFATVTIVPNRLQQEVVAGQSTFFILDTALIEQAFLTGYNVQDLAKTGLADNRQMSVDFGLRVGNEKGLAAYNDVDETAPMVA